MKDNKVPPEFLILSAALVQELKKDRRWSQERRDKWIKAFTAAVDLHYEIIADDEDSGA